MRKSSFYIFFLLRFCVILNAQPYGNEWINPNQTYIKIKIAQDGFYRVQGAALQQVGFPLSSVAVSRLRLYRSGTEVAIRTAANADGATLNYFEFWGAKNTGKSDAELYLPNAQPHQEYNLFSDTATYFLTWTSTSSSTRILPSGTNNTTGLTPEPFQFQILKSIQSARYSLGRRIQVQDNIRLSEYDLGEGFTGQNYQKNGFAQFNFQFTDLVTTAVLPSVAVVAIGENSLAHRVTISAGTTAATLVNLGTLEFNGYTFLKQSFEIPLNAIAPDGSTVIRLTATGYPETAENVSFPLVSVKYPQAVRVGLGENKQFNLRANELDQSYLQVSTGGASDATEFFDITNPSIPVKLTQSNFTNRVDLLVNGTSSARTVAAVSSPLTSAVLSAYQFQPINLSNKNYLIITHPLLRQLNGQDPVAAYAQYRESLAGGNHRVTIANISDVYDQYNYGDPSPIAISRLMKRVYGTIQNVFIIGKARTSDANFFRNYATNPAAFNNIPVMIPTYGEPGGDFMFVRGLDPANLLSPAIPIGRLNARSAATVASYLQKVQEQEALPFNQLWRKDFIHLSGGQTNNERTVFANYIAGFKAVTEGDYLGGRAFSQTKTTNSTVENINIAARVNEGVGLITLFGHSSSTVSDIEIGLVSNPDQGYNNKGKYPIILVNGCNAGSIFGNTLSFGEDWMLTPEKGSVGFIAHSSFATSINLKRFSDLFYSIGLARDETFGSSVGQILQQVGIEYYSRFGSSEFNQTQVLQTMYQGDPALYLFKANQPDFTIISNSIQAQPISGDRILSSQPALILQIPVTNFAKTTTQNLKIRVERMLPDGTTANYESEFNAPRRADTLSFLIENTLNQQIPGLHIFNIVADPDREIAELNESNNTGRIELFLTRGNTNHLFPIDYAMTDSSRVALQFQPVNLLENNPSFALEIDTSNTFQNPLRSEILTGNQLITYNFEFSTFDTSDTLTFYWRTRYANQAAPEDSIWTTTTFTFVPGNNDGWGQFSQKHFNSNQFSGISIDPVTEKLDFSTTSLPINLRVMGTDVFSYENLQILINEVDYLLTSNTIDPFCATNTFNAIGFDRVNASSYYVIPFDGADVSQPLVCGRLPQHIYNFTQNNILGTQRYLELFINNLKTGDAVAFFSFDSVAFSNWDQPIYTALEAVGVATTSLSGLVNGQPLIIFGRKGMSPGQAIVLTNNGTTSPVKQQELVLNNQVTGKGNSGIMTIPRIGPAISWQSMNGSFLTNTNDQVQISLTGINQSGEEVAINTAGRTDFSSDLAAIDAVAIPYLKMEVSFNDAAEQTLPEINFLNLSYTSPPEGIIINATNPNYILQEGQLIRQNFYYQNISKHSFTDSIEVTAAWFNDNSGILLTQTIKLAPIDAGDTAIAEFEFDTRNQIGMNQLQVVFSPTEVELYTNNNAILYTNFANISADKINPVLDVTIDGRYPLNGEIVSAEPIIAIRIKDENPFLLKSDTTGITIDLKRPGNQSLFERVPFSGNEVIWTAAAENRDFEIDFRPANLTDGVYTLKVQVADESGNAAATQPYEIQFEIINESTITHFYPYPNPFSTQCRFVFTLTGSTLPDQLLIQIMTISGTVVREITLEELGPIQIGNNLSSFVWDGTDQFGDRLANGVYLYRVMVRQDGKEINRRSTVADKAFKEGFGKIYILR